MHESLSFKLHQRFFKIKRHLELIKSLLAEVSVDNFNSLLKGVHTRGRCSPPLIQYTIFFILDFSFPHISFFFWGATMHPCHHKMTAKTSRSAHIKWKKQTKNNRATHPKNQHHARKGAHILSRTAHLALTFVLGVPGSIGVVDRPTSFCRTTQAGC